MATSYTRQSSMADGDTITAALFNDEFNQLLTAFSYASTSTTGHRHDGTAAEGGNIHTIGDQDFLNKIVADSTNNRWGVFVQVSSSAVEQVRFQDGVIVPVTDNDIDLGTSSVEFKDAFFDGTVTTDGLTVSSTTNLDGAIQLDNTLTAGVDGTGYDIKFFGDTAGSFLLWDQSDDALELTDSTPLKIGDSADMQIYHDGSNSYITNAVGALKLATETSGIVVTIGHTTSETTVADNLTVTGNASIGGNLDVTGSFDMSDADITNIGSIALDTITNDGTNITLDSSGDIILDAGGADIFFKDDGTTFGSATNTSGNLIIKSGTTTALTFSGANVTGAGTYTGGGLMTTGGNIVIPDAGNIGSASDTDAIAISSGGVVTMNQIPVFSAGINVSGGTIAGTLSTAAQGSVTSLGTLTALTVDNLGINGNTITANSGALNLTPASGSAIVLDGTISIDAGVVTGATSVTSTAFVGALTGNVTGNTSGTAATVTTAAQPNITSLGTLTTLTVDYVIVNGTTIGHTDDTDLITLADGIVTVAGEVSLTTLDIGGTNVTSTAAELNYSDTGAAVGTVVASKVVTVDSNKDVSSFRNITLTGELDAGSLDVSGDADIDGTLEADAYTVDGTALNEYIADTVGAMVGSNTESGITVAYQDGDNTLDFTVGTLNQDTTGTADNFTASANNSTDETVYPVFVDGATGSQGAETDTGLTYNPSTGVLTATQFTGAVTGAITGTASVATTVTITDNESTNENNAIIFTAGGDLDGGNLGLESDGDLIYNPSTGLLSSTGVTASGTVTYGTLSDGTIGVTAWVDEDDMSSDSATLVPTQQSVKAYVDGITAGVATSITASANNSTDETVYPTFVDGATGSQGIETDTGFTYNPSSGLLTISGELDAGSLDISGNADIDGTLETDALSINGTAVTSTAAELNLIDGGTSRGTDALASGDGILINDGGTMKMTDVDTVKTFMDTNTDTKWDGGTTGLTASTGRTSLGLVIGTNVQAYDSDTAKLDTDQSWSGSQRGTPSTVTDGTLDLDTANNFKYTPSGADVLEFTNEEAGQSGFVTVINASGHAISVGSEVKKGSSWDVSTAGTYLVSYYSDGTNVYVSASEALS